MFHIFCIFPSESLLGPSALDESQRTMRSAAPSNALMQVWLASGNTWATLYATYPVQRGDGRCQSHVWSECSHIASDQRGQHDDARCNGVTSMPTISIVSTSRYTAAIWSLASDFTRTHAARCRHVSYVRYDCNSLRQDELSSMSRREALLAIAVPLLLPTVSNAFTGKVRDRA
jgi:hypothetical protein